MAVESARLQVRTRDVHECSAVPQRHVWLLPMRRGGACRLHIRNAGSRRVGSPTAASIRHAAALGDRLVRRVLLPGHDLDPSCQPATARLRPTVAASDRPSTSVTAAPSDPAAAHPAITSTATSVRAAPAAAQPKATAPTRSPSSVPTAAVTFTY